MSDDIQLFTQELRNHSKEINSVLPEGISARRFQRTVVNTLTTHPQAQRLLLADQKSLFSACLQAAADGLMVDGKESTLIAFKDKKKRVDVVQYIPMVQGLVKLARNSGEIDNLIAELVYKSDSFQYRPGVDNQPLHDPDWFGDRGAAIGVYAVVTLKSGEKIVRVMTREKIMKIAGVGNNADQYNPNTGPHYEEWWRKTAIKNVLKYAPKSSYLEQALDRLDKKDDERTEIDVTAHAEPVNTDHLLTAVKEGIESAQTTNDLDRLKNTIVQLPVEAQQEFIESFNEKMIDLKKSESELN